MEGPLANGDVMLRGTSLPDTAVVAENLHTGTIRGQRVGQEGTYEIAIPAEVGDRLALTVEEGTEQSSPIFVVIEPPATAEAAGAAGAAADAAGAAGAAANAAAGAAGAL